MKREPPIVIPQRRATDLAQPSSKPSLLVSIVAGFTICLCMFAIRYAIDPVMKGSSPNGLGIIGVVIAAYYFRFWAGIAASVGMLAFGQFFFANENHFLEFTPGSIVALTIIFAIGVAISIACERTRSSLDRVVLRESQLLHAANETARAYGMLYSVLDHAPMIVAFFDSDRTVSRINSGSKLPVLSWVGRTTVEILGDGGHALDQAIGDVFRTMEPVALIEFETHRSPIGAAWFTATLAPILADVDGRPSVCMVAIDTSERKQIEVERERMLQFERAAREEAEAAGKIKDEFVGTLSHELRTPLTSILGWADLIRLRGRDGEVVANGVAAIERSGRMQLQMIEDLLDLNRIQTGKLRLERSFVDAFDVVELALTSAQPSARAKGIEIVLDMRGEVQLYADPSRLQQVLSNLLSNAIKFSMPESIVHLRVRTIGQAIEFTVSDKGQGIDPLFLPHVFERFRQAEGTASRRYGGLGLGLAIVKEIVEMHGGTVTAASDGWGKGATFTVSIPIGLSHVRTSSGADSEFEEAVQDSLIGIRVALIEDDADSRRSVTELLRTLGATVQDFPDAVSALRGFAEFGPCVVLCDVAMPEVDGFEFLRRLRKSDDTSIAQLPTLALTALLGVESESTFLNAGFTGALAKPISVPRIVKALRAYKPHSALR